MRKLTPAPEWIFAESTDGRRQFILHTTTPRFLAEIFDEDESELAAAAILDAVSIALNNGQTLANIVWLDAHSELSDALVGRISNALDDYDSRLADSIDYE